MFRTGSIFIRILGVILIVTLLVSFAGAVFQFGFVQGAALGSAGDASGLVPGASPFFYQMMPYLGMFPILHLLGTFLVGLLILGILAAIFRPRHWGPMAAHPWHDRSHYPCPPAEEKDSSQSGPDKN